MRYIKTNKIIKVYSYCIDLVKSMVGTREGVIAYDERFRIDLENTCYKASMYNDLQQRIDKIRNYLEENRKQYIYQDGLGEDWYFGDLDVFDELLEILKGGNNE